MNFEIAPKETEIQANWDDAKFYCFSLNIDGKTGWRLPTLEELNEIYHSENNFEELEWYWSSTEWEENSTCVWCKFFYEPDRYYDCDNDGAYSKDYNDEYGGHYVRAVRDL